MTDYNITIIRSNRKTISIEVGTEGILVRAPRYVKDSEIKELLKQKEAWIIKQQRKLEGQLAQLKEFKPLTKDEINALAIKAKKVIPPKVEQYAKLLGVSYGRITIRCQKTRWGSCSSKGNLNFNCLLMLFPDEVIDSVVAHELCHRKHMNHSKRFYDELSRVFPDYARCRKWLRENGSMYLKQIT